MSSTTSAVSYIAKFSYNSSENWAECEGIRITKPVNGDDPVYTMFREMVRNGLPDGQVTMVNENTGTPSMRYKSFHRSSKFDIVEDDNGIRIVKWTPPAITVVKTTNGDQVSKVIVTNNQREALAIVASGKIRVWNRLHGKTQNSVINAGWVIMVEDEDGYKNRTKPILTEAGKKILEG